jgi:ribosomal protein S30
MTTPEERNRKKYEVRLQRLASDPAYREAFLKRDLKLN